MRRYAIAFILIAVLLSVSAAALAQTKKPVEKAKDPVCGIMVEKDPALSANHKGEVYYFCSKADAAEFKKHPEKYVKKD